MVIPLRHGGLALTSVTALSALSYAASLIDTSDVRASWMPRSDESALVDDAAPRILEQARGSLPSLASRLDLLPLYINTLTLHNACFHWV